jgi:excisionase family DNA binding protein
MSKETLVGISEACQILSVSETSLRQWTDEGKIKAFVTPGGHRRYLVADLKKFMSSHQKIVGIRDLVVELEDVAHPLREMARTVFPAKAWYSKLGTDSQQRLAGLGRDMLQIIVRYASEPSKREESMGMARNIGHDFGQTLAEIGLPLTDSLEAFILHRDPIMNAATHLMKRREAFTGRVVEAIPLVAHVIDEALVSLVAAHQKYRNGIQNELKKEGV